MASIDIVPEPSTSPRPPETPPDSSTLPASEQVLTVKDARQFLEVLRTFQATQTVPAPGGAIQPFKTKETSEDKQQAAARASKLDLKTVSKV
jgi:hypothetical protein